MREASDIQTIAALSPLHVGGYLQGRGWADYGPYGAFGRLYRREFAGQEKEVVLPTRSSISDFAKRMSELVRDLAQAEERSARSVIFDLTLAPFDVIRVRSKDADDYGSIRFAEGVQLHEEAAIYWSQLRGRRQLKFQGARGKGVDPIASMNI